MNERELRAVLGAEVELPSAVEAGLERAYGQIRAQGRRAVRPRRGLRTALMLAAVAAALCAGAAAVWFIGHGGAYQAFFGNESRPSVKEKQAFNDWGEQILALPNEERVPVDEARAEAVVGEYLPEEGYTWHIGEYTFTVESYLLDEETGTGKISYSIARPGGVEGLTVSLEDGEVWANGAGIAVVFFPAKALGKNAFGSRTYLDGSRSAEDTLYLVASLAAEDGWRAEDGIAVEFRDLRRNAASPDHLDVSLVQVLSLPGLPSLPSTPVRNGEGEEVLRFSAVGMLLRTDGIGEVGCVALEYADGTRYVVSDKGNNIRNTDYELGTGSRPEMELMLCFNRLVDPARVSAVVVDGTVYPVLSE